MAYRPAWLWNSSPCEIRPSASADCMFVASILAASSTSTSPIHTGRQRSLIRKGGWVRRTCIATPPLRGSAHLFRTSVHFLSVSVSTPQSWGPFGRDFLFGLIATIQSPLRFTKFAGLDANGDIFDNNDRVGIEPRNTFVGDNFRSVDIRVSRTFRFREKRSLEVIAEGFN